MTVMTFVALSAPLVGAASLFVPGVNFLRRWLTAVSLSLAAIAVVASTPHQSSSGLWATDRLGWLLALASLFIGLCVCQYAIRQFNEEQRGRRILAASLATISGIVATDLARTPAALIVSWIFTSALTVVLLRVSEPGRRGRLSDSIAFISFAVGDSILLIGTAIAYFLVGESFASMDLATRMHGTGATVLLAAGTLAAVVRSGLTFRRSWVTDTINVPTSTSALLHAGVVNSGALLLWRLHELAGNVIAIDVGLAVLCVAVLVDLAPKIHARVDLKGQLAASTVAQMAFMLLAMALGFPVLAVTHLIGHGIYKASRFMSAGGATQQRARLRRRLPRGRVLSVPVRSVGVLGLVAFAALIGANIHPNGAVVMGVFGPAAAVLWWSRTGTPVRAAMITWIAVLATLAFYGCVLIAVGGFIEPEVIASSSNSPWWTLGLVILVVALISLRRRHVPAVTTIAVASSATSAPFIEDGVAA
ncbi:MAG: hypothetical protein HIU84_07930 [Acidobacteria bacterium]|nr:hypothetical protein [Acidobacteriota bacterium]